MEQFMLSVANYPALGSRQHIQQGQRTYNEVENTFSPPESLIIKMPVKLPFHPALI
ncbi:MAG: hypothetical protein ACQ9MH_12440 [Nitrospinales bacterium]